MISDSELDAILGPVRPCGCHPCAHICILYCNTCCQVLNAVWFRQQQHFKLYLIPSIPLNGKSVEFLRTPNIYFHS